MVHHLGREHAGEDALDLLAAGRLRAPEPDAAHDLHAIIGQHRPGHGDLDAPDPEKRQGDQRIAPDDQRGNAHAPADADMPQAEEREPANQQVSGNDPAPRNLPQVIAAQHVVDRVEVRIDQWRARLQRRRADVSRGGAVGDLSDQHRLFIDVARGRNRRALLRVRDQRLEQRAEVDLPKTSRVAEVDRHLARGVDRDRPRPARAVAQDHRVPDAHRDARGIDLQNLAERLQCERRIDGIVYPHDHR